MALIFRLICVLAVIWSATAWVRGAPGKEEENVLEFLELAFKGFTNDPDFRFGPELRDAHGKLLKVRRFVNTNNVPPPVMSEEEIPAEETSSVSGRKLAEPVKVLNANMANPVFQCDPNADVYSMTVGNYNMNYQTVPALPADTDDKFDWASFALELAMNPTLCVYVSFDPLPGKSNSFPQANYNPSTKRAVKSPIPFNINSKTSINCVNCYGYIEPGSQLSLSVDLGSITNPTPVATLGVAVNSGMAIHGQVQFTGPAFNGKMSTKTLMPYKSYSIVKADASKGNPFGLTFWNGLDLAYGGQISLPGAKPTLGLDFMGPSLMAGYSEQTEWEFGFSDNFNFKNAIYKLVHQYENVEAWMNASLILKNEVDLSVSFSSYKISLKVPLATTLSATLSQTNIDVAQPQSSLQSLECNSQSTLTLVPGHIKFEAAGFDVDLSKISNKLNLQPRTIAIYDGSKTCVTSGSIQPIGNNGILQQASPVFEPGPVIN